MRTNAPDRWDGDAVSWPVSNIRDDVELAKENVTVVLADIKRTTGLHPDITVANYMGGVQIDYDGAHTSPSVSAPSNPDALVETADYLQEHVAEDVGTAGQATLWPVCPKHMRRLHPEVDDGHAVWKCPLGHVASLIGQLPAAYGADPSE